MNLQAAKLRKISRLWERNDNMAVIETKKLTKSYGKARGRTELDLTVNEGEFFGFIGPNGAGKSTTIRTLLGLIFPTSGEAKVFGKDIVRDKTEILARVGYMRSEAAFYNGMYVQQAVASCFSKKAKYPKQPLSLVEKAKPLSGAEQFKLWAQEYNRRFDERQGIGVS